MQTLIERRDEASNHQQCIQKLAVDRPCETLHLNRSDRGSGSLKTKQMF